MGVWLGVLGQGILYLGGEVSGEASFDTQTLPEGFGEPDVLLTSLVPVRRVTEEGAHQSQPIQLHLSLMALLAQTKRANCTPPCACGEVLKLGSCRPQFSVLVVSSRRLLKVTMVPPLTTTIDQTETRSSSCATQPTDATLGPAGRWPPPGTSSLDQQR